MEAPSPWGTLNDDPLLSRAPTTPYKAPPPVSKGAIESRQMKTLEQVEAEMRAAAQSQPPPQGSQGPRALTIEEVEADILRNARQPPSQPPSSSNPIQPILPTGASPQVQPSFAPGNLPLPPGMYPPGMPPAMVAMLQAQQQQQLAQNQAPAGSFPPPFPRGVVAPNVAHQSPHPVPHPATLSHVAFPPLGSSPRPPLPPSVPQGANLMATLFPPLPSQSQILHQQQLPPTSNLAQVEQQLQFLTLNQHAQHPSFTSANLQSLLQQAQEHAAVESKAAEGFEEGTLEGNVDDANRRKAGEDLIRQVEARIREHEELEAMRKKKAMKIASMVRLFSLSASFAFH